MNKFLWLVPVLLIISAHFLIGAFISPNFQNKFLEGQLVFSMPLQSGVWSPRLCLDGSEENFTGIIFKFNPRDRIAKVLVDAEVVNENFMEVHYQLNEQAPIRIFEKDCHHFDGDITRKKIVLNRRSMFRVVGAIDIDCPEQGLKLQASFDGCLPESMN